MNIFISWSGETSMQIAEKLKNFIPKIIQQAKPYYTPADIEKGTWWQNEINKKLAECLIGLICLTKDNTEKPWILFEAGALSNRLDNSKVCPILFGLKKSEITGPLAQIQLTEFSKVEFLKLMQSINSSLEDLSIGDGLLVEMVEAFYPNLEQEINVILENAGTPVTRPQRTERDILEEVLDLVRKQNTVKLSLDDNNKGHMHLYSNGQRNLYSDVSERNFYEGISVAHPHHGVGMVMRKYEVANGSLVDVKFISSSAIITFNTTDEQLTIIN